MRLAMIGLGKMGGNMVRRLRRSGIEPRVADAVQLPERKGLRLPPSVDDA